MLLISSSEKQKQSQNIKNTEGTSDSDPLAFTFAAHFSVLELEEESSGIMTIK